MTTLNIAPPIQEVGRLCEVIVGLREMYQGEALAESERALKYENELRAKVAAQAAELERLREFARRVRQVYRDCSDNGEYAKLVDAALTELDAQAKGGGT